MRGRGTRVLAVWIVFVAGLVGAGSTIATAQPGDTTIVIDQASPLLAGYDYVVRVTTADGAPVNGAQVTATPIGPDGRIGSMFTLAPQDEDGRYRSTVEMPAPGTWTVRFAVADPMGNLEHVQEVGLPTDDPQVIPTPDAETPADDPAAEPSPTDAVPTDDAAAEDDADGIDLDNDVVAPAEDDSNRTPVLVAAVVLALAVTAAALVITRRRKESDADTDAADTDDTGTAAAREEPDVKV